MIKMQRGDRAWWGMVPVNATELMKGLEHNCDGERLRDLGRV